LGKEEPTTTWEVPNPGLKKFVRKEDARFGGRAGEVWGARKDGMSGIRGSGIAHFAGKRVCSVRLGEKDRKRKISLRKNKGRRVKRIGIVRARRDLVKKKCKGGLKKRVEPQVRSSEEKRLKKTKGREERNQIRAHLRKNCGGGQINSKKIAADPNLPPCLLCAEKGVHLPRAKLKVLSRRPQRRKKKTHFGTKKEQRARAEKKKTETWSGQKSNRPACPIRRPTPIRKKALEKSVGKKERNT